MKQSILPQMKMKKFEEDISAFREELINKKTNFVVNIGIPKLNLKDTATKEEMQLDTSVTARVLAPP